MNWLELGNILFGIEPIIAQNLDYSENARREGEVSFACSLFTYKGKVGLVLTADWSSNCKHRLIRRCYYLKLKKKRSFKECIFELLAHFHEAIEGKSRVL